MAPEHATLPLPSANGVYFDPRWRKLEVLSELIEKRAGDLPRRAAEWRAVLSGLEENAVGGVLPTTLDPVLRTVFHDLFYLGANAPGLTSVPAPLAAVTTTAPASSGFWQKELTLKRSPKPKQPKSDGESIWRKEVSLKRAPNPRASEKATGEDEHAATTTPFWKKDLSLKRAPKTPAQPQVEQAPAEQPRAPKQPKAAQGPTTPWWKKELSFGGKSDAKPKPAGTAPKPAAAAPKPKSAKAKLSATSLRLPDLRLSLGRRADRETGRVVGLRIGSSQLAAALIHNNGTAELQQVARAALHNGVVVGGEVRDADALARSLRAFFRDCKLPREGIRLGIANNRIGVRVLEVPAIDDEAQFTNAVRFRTQEVLPIPIADAVVDHVTLGDSADGNRQVLVVFAHKDLVEGYLEAFRRAGLKLAGIDLDAFALLRAVGQPPAEDAENRTAIVAVAIGDERTIFAVSDGHVCDFTRVFEWGGAAITASLAETLELTPEEAERAKRSLTMSGDANGDLPPAKVEAARTAVREQLEVLARELLSSLQFYQSRPGSLAIGEILLSGGGAQLDSIDAELARALGVPVRIADPLARVTLGTNVFVPRDRGSLAIAVGLAIEERH